MRNRLARLNAGAATLIAFALVAAPALAAPPKATITSPAAGQTVSKAAGILNVAGSTGFATPAKTDRKMFLRRPACANGTTDRMYLSVADGADTSGCTLLLQTLASTNQFDFTETYKTEGETNAITGLPIALDATKPLTGSIAIRGTLPNALVIEVGVQLNDTIFLGPATFNGSPGATGGDFALSFPLSADLDKIDVTSVKVTVVLKQSVGLAYTSLDNPASFITIPAYSSSFNRSVEVSLDDPDFYEPNLGTLSADLKSYTAELPLPSFTSLGAHTVYVRSVQGGEPGPARTVAINVVE